jgi:hypothetical protein
MTATLAQKAAAILTGNRLMITRLDAVQIEAVCTGSTGTRYELGLDPAGWHCSCPAFGPGCSHLEALRLVTITRRRIT